MKWFRKTADQGDKGSLAMVKKLQESKQSIASSVPEKTESSPPISEDVKSLRRSPGYELKWKQRVGVIQEQILASVDTMYLPIEGGYLCALDCETGEMKWKSKPEGLSFIKPMSELDNGLIFCTGSSMPYPKDIGPDSTESDTANWIKAIGSFRLNTKFICAIDAQTGLIKWHTKTNYSIRFASSTPDGKVLVWTDSTDSGEAGRKPTTLYLFNGSNGGLEWEMTSENWECMPVGYEGALIVGHRKENSGRGGSITELVSIDLSSKKFRWRLPVQSERVQFPGRQVEVWFQLFFPWGDMVVGGGMVCFVTYDAKQSCLYQADVLTGDLSAVWTFERSDRKLLFIDNNVCLLYTSPSPRD